jgi:hypothetical protein
MQMKLPRQMKLPMQMNQLRTKHFKEASADEVAASCYTKAAETFHSTNAVPAKA